MSETDDTSGAASGRSRTFIRSPEDAEIIVDWWRGLDASRGERAELRRADDVDAIVFCRAFHELLHQLQRRPDRTHAIHKEGVARIAGVLARVVEDSPGRTVARALGQPRDGGDRAVFSEQRMRRLLETEPPDEALHHLHLAVRQLGGSCDVIDLAEAAYWWSARTRRDWAYAYYDAAPARSSA